MKYLNAKNVTINVRPSQLSIVAAKCSADFAILTKRATGTTTNAVALHYYYYYY